MSIVFSAIVPHSPFLIPTVGKENLLRLKATESSFRKLEEDLYASKAETIIIISPHGSTQSNSFTMNVSPEFVTHFDDFGDLTTKINFTGDIGLAHKIRERMETKAPLQLISEPKLDYGSGVPLYLLTPHLPKIKIIPIYYSGLDLEAHLKFGQLLKRELMVNKNRVAIIASGDLSHRLTRDAPAGYSPKAKKFDQKIIDYLLNKKTDDIIKLKHNLLAEVCECGLKSIIILLGTLSGINYQPQTLSYEAPFGVGYLVMRFEL
jgi:AmmeMemoRadiSam system protein B